MSSPKDLRYTKEHEWARVDDDGSVVVGITEHAAEQLGDIVYVELPDMGAEIAEGDEFGSVESVKAVSELYAPLDGKVIELNDKLEDIPEMVNEDPYGEGWLIRVAPRDPAQLDELMDAGEYDAFVDEQDD